jgi:Uma2 family endonuclease
MSPPGRRHKAFVANLAQLLIVRLAGRAFVWVQSGVVLADDTEPEPDLSILRRRPLPYKDREAHTEDVIVVIEVADSSPAYDRSTKLRLYAEARIPEYWVVDCSAETIEVYRTPGPDGYRDVRRAAGTAAITLLAFPDVELTISEIFA